MAVLSFLVLFLMVHKGYIYTIAVHPYAFCTAFSTKTHCVLHHIALRFAPYCTPFCCK